MFYNHGVNLAVENSQGDTPLDLARRRAMKVCIQFLEMALKRKLPRSPLTKQVKEQMLSVLLAATVCVE